MIVIIGGGIIGLATGWRLAQAGKAVTIFERGACGQEASWAAAGMIYPGSSDHPNDVLMRESAGMWPDFAAELQATTGIDVGFWRCGSLKASLQAGDPELRATWETQRALGWDVAWLDGPAARQMEPALAEAVQCALWTPEMAQVENRAVNPALKQAFLAAGGQLREHCPVEALVIEGDRAVGVRAGGEVILAEAVVMAAGAWSGSLAEMPASCRPPVFPVKGQMVSVQVPAGHPLIQRMVTRPGGTLVPRRDGRILIGATKEPDAGFDKAIIAGTIADLIDDASRYVPAVRQLPLVETWSGLRPGTPDQAPILGPTPLPGLVLACGHYTDGILQAPVTARIISQYLLEGTWPPALRPFLIDRFA